MAEKYQLSNRALAMFSRADADWFSSTSLALYSAQSVSGLAAAALDALDKRFALHSFAFEEISQEFSSYQLHKARCAVPPPVNYAAYFHDNPFLWVIGAGQPPPVLHMRGHAASKGWERTDHFNGIARPMGWNDQMMIVAQARPSFVSVGMHRDTHFSPDEVFLVTLLQPHVTAAWMRVQPSQSEQLPSLDITLSAHLRPTHVTRAQNDVLRSYFPRWRHGVDLPDELRTWVAQSVASLRGGPAGRPMRAFTVDSARGRLLVRCFPQVDQSFLLRLLETPAVPNFLNLRACGLTPRECEVLHWVSHGKRDAEIAAIINAAPRTIKKHVENVLRKLHVETRGAAVRTARSKLDGTEED